MKLLRCRRRGISLDVKAMGERYVVVLGAPTSLSFLERALREACASLEIREHREGTRGAHPVTPMSSVELRLSATTGLISHRRTPTAILRRIVVCVATRFGAALLCVRRRGEAYAELPLHDCRSANTSLVGFLRSGRVVQEDTLLNVRRAADPGCAPNRGGRKSAAFQPLRAVGECKSLR